MKNSTKHSVLLGLTIFLSTTLFAQTATDSVKQVINNLFAAMHSADSALLRSCFSTNAVMHTIASKKGEGAFAKEDSVEAFVKSVAAMPKGAADERIEFADIKIDGDMAQVWTPYQFYYNGNFSHCGVNAFILVRTNHVWKIQYIIDTRRKTNC